MPGEALSSPRPVLPLLLLAGLAAAVLATHGCGTTSGKVSATATSAPSSTPTPAGSPPATLTPAYSYTTTPTSTRGWHIWPTTTPIVPSNLWGVQMISSGVGWIVGDAGTILTINAGAWQPYGVTVTTQHLYAISFATNGNGWIVGANGTVARWIGSIWALAPTPAPTGVSFFAVSAYPFASPTAGAATGFFVCGAGGYAYQYDQSAGWLKVLPDTSPTPTIPPVDLYAASGGQNTWFAGLNGLVINANNIAAPAMIPLPAGTPSIFGITHEPGTASAWAVGANGSVFLYGGGSWNVVGAVPTTSITLNAVTTVGGHIFIVGDLGTTMHFDPGGSPQWTLQQAPTSANLTAVSMVSATSGWAVGQGGVILQYY